jgi:Gram-negative bacterial TonB protein C-terminal
VPVREREKIQKLLRPRGVGLCLKKAGNPVALQTMRRFALVCFACTIATQFAAAADLPVYRPALIGSAPDAIINRIDTNLLLKAGQKNAAVMFVAAVEKTGEVKWSGTYRGTPDSKLLEQELQRALGNAKMIPAIRNREPVSVFYYGTVVFEVINNKPRLRIFANQEANELKTENDFISPQPCLGADSKFDGLHYPSSSDAPLAVSGAVELSLKVDAEGNLQGEKVVSEYPPLLGFGQAAMDDFAAAKFIPAFRNGQPVPCEITLPLYYRPKS